MARALEKVLGTEVGASLLPSLVPSPGIDAAIAARGAPALRLLAAGVLARVVGSAACGTPSAAAACAHLAALLADPDPEVGAKAEAALVAAAASGGGGPLLRDPALPPLQATLASPDAVIRARGLSVVIALLACPDQEVAARAKAAGLLGLLAAEVGGAPADPLAGAAALAALAAAVEAGNGSLPPATRARACAALLADLGAPLAGLISGGGGGGGAAVPSSVWGQALATAATLCSGALLGGAGADAAVDPTLTVIASALDAHLGDASVEDDPAREEAALEAAGALGVSAPGAAALAARAPAALAGLAAKALGARGGAGGRGGRVLALHALATLAGAERVRVGDAAGALLGPPGEAALAGALHAAAADGRPVGTLPAAAFAALVAQPLEDVRVAALRALLPLVAARPWAAADAAACPDLMGRLTAASAWAASGAAEWRHAVVLGMLGTARGGGGGGDEGLAPAQRAALAGAVPALEGAVRAGVHGFGVGGRAVGAELATRAG